MEAAIEFFLCEVAERLGSFIHRHFGKTGCVVAVLAPLTMLGLIVWLLVR